MEAVKTHDEWINRMNFMPIFKKYSQCGEEGYIEHILANVKKKCNLTYFLVDIGASDGEWLSNSKYFIEKYNYNAILLDGDNKGKDDVVHKEWLTAENICEVLEKYKCPKEFDFLSFDTDGNDIYILEKILEKYQPKVIVSEFNPIWKKSENKTIAYNPNHTWNNDTYYGYSFAAGKVLAEKFGYKIIFQNGDLNLYYVKKDFLQNADAELEINYKEGMLYHAQHPEGKVWVEYK